MLAGLFALRGLQRLRRDRHCAARLGAQRLAPAAGRRRPVGAGGLVGIAMPTKSSARWIADGDNLVEVARRSSATTTDLQYAEDDIPTQVSQVENMITKGAKVLVIAAIDGTTLTDTLQKAADAGIKVFAYDRLIRDSPERRLLRRVRQLRGRRRPGAARSSTRLDLEQRRRPVQHRAVRRLAGRQQRRVLLQRRDVDPAAATSTAASSSSSPGETEFPDQVGTLRWDGAAAQARMDNILATHYADKRVDAVLSPYDGISRGIIASLKQVGYYTADKPAPVVTGQDAELPSVKSILADEQTSTVFKDTRTLAAQVAKMVDQFLKGETVEVNDTETYENGVKVVPSFLLAGRLRDQGQRRQGARRHRVLHRRPTSQP